MSGGSEMLSFSTGAPDLADTSALPESGGLEEVSNSVSASDAESGPSAWDGKLALFLQVAQQRRTQLLWLARRFANSREEAEDIVQEGLLKAFKHLSQFRGESQMSTWLGVIVLNAGREWVRTRKRRVFQRLEYVSDKDDDSVAYDLPDPGRDPEQSCGHREMEDILRSEIDELNSVCKSAIKMCTIEGLSHLEAANELGVNVLTIKSRIHHAKRMLKRAVRLRDGGRNRLSRSLEPTLW
jgi:RNA polymerase sigma-70 factor (ECF subfamily)